MPSMTSRERVLCVLAGEIPDRVPYGELGIDFPFICRLLGLDLPVGQFFEAGEYQSPPVEIQLRVNQALHRDFLVYNMLPPIPAVKHTGKDGIRFFGDGRIKGWDDLDQLQLPDPSKDEFLSPVRNFLEQKGDYATVCATRVGVSAAYLAMGMESFFYALHDDPRLINELLKRYTDFAAAVVEVAASLGFDLIWTSDDIAFKNGPFVSPQVLREQVFPYIRKVANRIRDFSLPWVYHSDGNLTSILEDLISLGIRGLNPIEPACMDIREVMREYRDRIVLIGNVDVNLLATGTPVQVRNATLDLLRDVAPEGSFMLASGNSITSYCQVACVQAMCNTLMEKGGYPIAIG